MIRRTRSRRKAITTTSNAHRATSNSSNRDISTNATMTTQSASRSNSSLAMAPGTAGDRLRSDRDHKTTSAMSNSKTQAPSDETKIDVFVRCRGRNAREMREDSGIVVNMNGVKSQTIELSMGANAMNNKTYAFDAVFSPLADQRMIFDEAVRPVLDEVRKGFNCTIFAYGQTGTGKTYTMSGDISDHTLLSDDAGIIPRALHAIFLDQESPSSANPNSTVPEMSVKVSFIELYNEELRDLLSSEEKSNLKIFEGDGKRGGATLVQGMEEHFINSAKNGLDMLRSGSAKRQVAATKCNDLSSRSHTIFTVTVQAKRMLPSGEEILSSGKLNLVDLAGSENIGRSGAEKKRAAEAGLINKSLLTLGRVINALVDRSSHIPYRESKLTRILQDSLGGRTKTCIIATLSPAKADLEETISSLDYAFRAKDIRNKPQINPLIPKKTVLREFTMEIEKLKSELSAARHKNGVYLPPGLHEELQRESESLRVNIKEQQEQIESMQVKLARKGQDLFELTTLYESLKKDNEKTKELMESTKSSLEQEKLALSQTMIRLNAESRARLAAEGHVQRLTNANNKLTASLDQSTIDITLLHQKLERQSELHIGNQAQFDDTRSDVIDTMSKLDNRLAEFQAEQQRRADTLSTRLRGCVESELAELKISKATIGQQKIAFQQLHREVMTHAEHGNENLIQALGQVKVFQEEAHAQMDADLHRMDKTLGRIPKGITEAVEAFGVQLHSSYNQLGADFKTEFDHILNEVIEQRERMQRIRKEMTEANVHLEEEQSQSLDTLSGLLTSERVVRSRENDDLVQHIQRLLTANMQQQELRLEAIESNSARINSAVQQHGVVGTLFASESERLLHQSTTLSNRLTEYRTAMDTRLEDDHKTAMENAESLKATASSVHKEGTATIAKQLQELETRMRTLNETMCRVQEESKDLHRDQERSLSGLADTVQAAYKGFAGGFDASAGRIAEFSAEIQDLAGDIQDSLPELGRDGHVRGELADLKHRTELATLTSYASTGETPLRKTHQPLLVSPDVVEQDHSECEEFDCAEPTGLLFSIVPSPNKMPVFADDGRHAADGSREITSADSKESDQKLSLRELDVNSLMKPVEDDGSGKTGKPKNSNNRTAANQPRKRSAVVNSSLESKVPTKMRRLRSDREVEEVL